MRLSDRLATALTLLPALVGGAALLPWAGQRSTSPESWTGLALCAVGVVLALRSTSSFARQPLSCSSSGWALWLLVAGSALVVAGAVVEVRLVSAAGVVIVAFAGVAVTTGRLAGPALALVLLGLPLSGDVDVVGFPLRRLSASLAAAVLPALGVPVVAGETVLVAESGVADVEAPCAGLATVRLLVAFVLVLASLGPHRARAVAAAVAVAVAAAVFGNAARVTALAWLVLGQGRPDLAGLLHVPLGVSVFVAAAFASRAVLRAGERASDVAAASSPAPPGGRRVAATTGALAALAFVCLRGTAARAIDAVDDRDLVAALAAEAQSFAGPSTGALSPGEAELFGRHALLATKRAVGAGEAAGARGEALVVVARSLRALHAPERCLAAAGHVVVTTDVAVRGGGLRGDAVGVAVKRLVLDGGRHVGLSFLRSTKTHATGIAEVAAARLHGDRGPWVFVSAVLDDGADEDAVVSGLVEAADRLLGAARSPSGVAAARAPLSLPVPAAAPGAT